MKPECTWRDFVKLLAIVVTGCWSVSCLGQTDPAAGEAVEPRAEHTNALAHETSPYLLLHAHNPVDWRPWSPAAFELAKQGNKPVFLSIGYSSCYWCHVMEREVFENEEIAAYVNEHFVCIKVDREERPDVDDLYMLAVQIYFRALGSEQTGGWPLSMFLTPDGKPFAGGTYFPAEDMPGRPGFLTVAKQVQELWATRQEALEGNAEFIAREVQRLSRPALSLTTVAIDGALVKQVVDLLQSTYDPDFGGFDFDPAAPDGPKFPTPSKLMLIQSQIDEESDAALAEHLDHTLGQMADGGVRDHLGGGFHRYSVDRQWRVPHLRRCCTTTRSWPRCTPRRIAGRIAARTGRSRRRRSTSSCAT
jgi:uncharacterized protein YyaL (SSP411 family)